jgi:beta-alanine degradation protein BauB
MTQHEATQPIGSRVLFEDDRVRVWELVVGPGEAFPAHHHSLDYVTISLDDADLEAHEADGTVRRNHRLPGDIQYTRVGGGQQHELRNVGSTVYRNRIVEFKQPLGSPTDPTTNTNLSAPRSDVKGHSGLPEPLDRVSPSPGQDCRMLDFSERCASASTSIQPPESRTSTAMG